MRQRGIILQNNKLVHHEKEQQRTTKTTEQNEKSKKKPATLYDFGALALLKILLASSKSSADLVLK